MIAFLIELLSCSVIDNYQLAQSRQCLLSFIQKAKNAFISPSVPGGASHIQVVATNVILSHSPNL